MAVPDTDHYRAALSHGDTLPRRPHAHRLDRSKLDWIQQQRARGSTVVAVELAEDAVPLTLLRPARQTTVILLGHERHGFPEEAWPLVDDVVEIPMVGRGASLNVAVAGSLVLSTGWPGWRDDCPAASHDERRLQWPTARARRVRRLRTPVLPKIDLRWSWTVCSERNINCAMWRVSTPVVR